MPSSPGSACPDDRKVTSRLHTDFAVAEDVHRTLAHAVAITTSSVLP